MQIYIDQSLKIEQTHQDTVLAFSNGKQKSLMIKAEDKRKLQEMFREAGKPHMFVYKTFAVLIFLLIQSELKYIQEIVIDREYSGQEHLIKNIFLQTMRRKKYFIDPGSIYFDRIGKKSKAHELAISVFRGQQESDLVISYKDVVPYVL